MDARTAALKALLRVLRDGASLTEALEGVSAQLPAGPESGLARELSYGVLRWHGRLSAIAGLLIERPLKERDRDVQLLVLLGLYQLLELKTPSHAAVGATAELARGLRKDWAVGLVNAVLRRFLREQDDLLARLPAMPEVRFSHPQWMVERLRKAWPDRWEAVLAANNARPPMTLRVNLRRSTREDYLSRLSAAGIDALPHPQAAAGLVLAEPQPVDRLPGFEDGLVSVQDAAAQQAAVLMDVPEGARVLDACAAPGGKTAHLLERFPALGELVAVELDPARMRRVESGLQRLGLAARLITGDAGDPRTWWDGRPFDRILLDVPCSGSGVIRRHPDIKWLRRPGDLAQFAQAQRRLLAAVWPLLGPGGKLVYSTCSVFPEENERVLAEFLAQRGDARAQAIEGDWGVAQSVGRQILTGEQGMDGFYYGCLTKL